MLLVCPIAEKRFVTSLPFKYTAVIGSRREVARGNVGDRCKLLIVRLAQPCFRVLRPVLCPAAPQTHNRRCFTSLPSVVPPCSLRLSGFRSVSSFALRSVWLISGCGFRSDPVVDTLGLNRKENQGCPLGLSLSLDCTPRFS